MELNPRNVRLWIKKEDSKTRPQGAIKCDLTKGEKGGGGGGGFPSFVVGKGKWV